MNDTLAPSARHEGDALASAVAKVKRHVLPLFVIMFIVNYLDRVNIGFVRPHLESDLGISAAAFGFGAGLFFIGYALFEVPSNMLLQKVGARLWLTRIMFTWGLGGALDVGRDVFVLHGHGGIHSQKIGGITANYTGSSQGIGRRQRIARRQSVCDRGGLSRCLHAARQRYVSLWLPGHAAFFCGYMLPRVFCQ